MDSEVSVWYSAKTNSVAAVGTLKAAADAADNKKRKSAARDVTEDDDDDDDVVFPPTSNNKRRATNIAFEKAARLLDDCDSSEFALPNAPSLAATQTPYNNTMRVDSQRVNRTNAAAAVAQPIPTPQMARAEGIYDHHFPFTAPVPSVAGLPPATVQRMHNYSILRPDGRPIELGPPDQIPPGYGNFTNADIDRLLNQWQLPETRRKFVQDFYDKFATPSDKAAFLARIEQQWKTQQGAYDSDWTQQRSAALELIRHHPAYNFLTLVVGQIGRPVEFLLDNGSFKTLQPALEARQLIQQSSARVVALLQTTLAAQQQIIDKANVYHNMFFNTIFPDSGLAANLVVASLDDFQKTLSNAQTNWTKDGLLSYYRRAFGNNPYYPNISKNVQGGREAGGPITTIDQLVPLNLKAQLNTATTIAALGVLTANTESTKQALLVLDADFRKTAKTIYELTKNNQLGAVAELPDDLTVISNAKTFKYWLLRPFMPSTLSIDTAMTETFPNRTDTPEIHSFANDLTQILGLPTATWKQTQLIIDNTNYQNLKGMANIQEFISWLISYIAKTTFFKNKQTQLATLAELLHKIRSGTNIIALATDINTQIGTVFAPTITQFADLNTAHKMFDSMFKLQETYEVSWLIDGRFSFLYVLIAYHMIRTFVWTISNLVHEHLATILNEAVQKRDEAVTEQRQLAEDDKRYGTSLINAEWNWLPENLGKVLYNAIMTAAIQSATDFVQRNNVNFRDFEPISIITDMSKNSAPFRMFFARLTAHYVQKSISTSTTAGTYTTGYQLDSLRRDFKQLVQELKKYKTTNDIIG